MLKRTLVGLIVTAAACTTAVAEQEVALTCKYERTTDEKGVVGETAGEASFVLRIGDDGAVVAISSSKCAGLAGTATLVAVDIQCAFDLGRVHVTDRFLIDRVNGSFKEFWTIGDGGLVHEGHCVVTKPIF